MEISLSQEVHEAGQKLAGATGNLADALNEILNQFLEWPFRASHGVAIDAEGHETAVFGTLIHTISQAQSASEPPRFHTDNVAGVIDVNETLDIPELRGAYERIASAKRLRKTVPSDLPGGPYTTVTLGIIFCRDTSTPLETLAKELAQLNGQHPDGEWTDMVVVLAKGVINFAVQFPGEGLSGDFLPPAEGATQRYQPPFYVILAIKPTLGFTFNKMCAFLFAHFNIFSPGSNLPNWERMLEGTPKMGMIVTGYQYNLSGKLMPVPRAFYNDRYIPPRPFLIEDRKGKLLATLKFLPWQDGGVILLTGKLPLDGLLVFLGKKALQSGGFVQRPHGQMSNVLSITQADFMQMLKRIERQSNMVVKLDPSKFFAQKIANEGTSSPFIARLFWGMLRLRDVVFPERAEQAEFDKAYQYVMETITNTRSTAQEISKLVIGHLSELTKGNIVQRRGLTIHIEKTIDKELRKEVETFLNGAVRALKQGMQGVATVLGINIGFLFKKESAFEKGLEELEKKDQSLAAYLRETRKWSELLIGSRNKIEHEGWTLPKIAYHEVSGSIQADEPEISGQKTSEFVTFILDRLLCFVEEVTAHALQARMPEGVTITEVPLPQRDSLSEIPHRFQVTLVAGGFPIWDIQYHQSSFEET